MKRPFFHTPKAFFWGGGGGGGGGGGCQKVCDTVDDSCTLDFASSFFWISFAFGVGRYSK